MTVAPDEADYGPPADRGTDPAEDAALRWERELVTRLRRRGVSWQNVAKQVGRCERALRGEYETLFAPQSAAQKAPSPTTPPKKAPLLGLRLLAAIEAEPGLTSAALARSIGVQEQNGWAALKTLQQRGEVRNLASGDRAERSCWTTTAAGRVRLALEGEALAA